MKLLPKTLFGRTVLILLLGLTVAQGISAFILLRDRGSAIYQASGFHLAQRVATSVYLLEILEPEERPRAARGLSSPGLIITLAPAAIPVQQNEDEAITTNRFRGFLNRNLGAEREVSVAVTSDPTAISGASPKRRFLRENGERPSRRYGTDMLIQVRLNDSSWARFHYTGTAELFSTPWRLLLILSVLLVSVVLLSLVAVRWLTHPLALLGQRAERLGRNINETPMREEGPLEVQRAAAAFNTMQRNLQRYINDRERLLGAVSHDLKTPITRLRLRAELIPEPALQAKFIADLEEMEAMVSSTLDFMRGDNQGEPMVPLDMNALLESIQEDMAELGQQVIIEGATSAPYPARPVAIKRCLVNLVQNAVKYGTRAEITVQERPGSLRITITDHGPGLSDEELRQVFEPFYRGEPSRSRDTGGIGLGLGIARNIARSHGGDVVLENVPEGGLKATVSLPRPA